MTKFVYVVVWGDFSDYGDHRMPLDRFYQYIFDSFEKAQSYVHTCLKRSAKALGDDEAFIPNISDIKVGEIYDCFSEVLCYDYITIKQYYLF